MADQFSDTTPVDNPPPSEPKELPDGWHLPKPEVMPRPTYAPAALAFGVTLLLWGLITSPLMLVVGVIIVIAALTGWIGALLHE